jgi:hypothetical protein
MATNIVRATHLPPPGGQGRFIPVPQVEVTSGFRGLPQRTVKRVPPMSHEAMSPGVVVGPISPELQTVAVTESVTGQ